MTFNILAPGVVQHHVTAGATWNLDPASSVTMALMYAFNNFAQGLAMREKIEMSEYSIGVQYARRF